MGRRRVEHKDDIVALSEGRIREACVSIRRFHEHDEQAFRRLFAITVVKELCGLRDKVVNRLLLLHMVQELLEFKLESVVHEDGGLFVSTVRTELEKHAPPNLRTFLHEVGFIQADCGFEEPGESA